MNKLNKALTILASTDNAHSIQDLKGVIDVEVMHLRNSLTMATNHNQELQEENERLRAALPKDHEIALAVNTITEIAKKHYGKQCLRQLISVQVNYLLVWAKKALKGEK